MYKSTRHKSISTQEPEANITFIVKNTRVVAGGDIIMRDGPVHWLVHIRDLLFVLNAQVVGIQQQRLERYINNPCEL